MIAFAFLMVFERFVFQFLTTLPPGITEDLYMIYGLQAFVIIGVFMVGILLVPSLTSSIFSGTRRRERLARAASMRMEERQCPSRVTNANWTKHRRSEDSRDCLIAVYVIAAA